MKLFKKKTKNLVRKTKNKILTYPHPPKKMSNFDCRGNCLKKRKKLGMVAADFKNVRSNL